MKHLASFICLGLVSVMSAQSLNQAVLDSIIRHSARTNSSTLLIYKEGKVVYKNYFGNAVQPIEAMSASKSVVSLAIGILLDKKLLTSPDQPVYTLYPEWNQGRKKEITVRHLLNHTSGLQNVPNAGVEIEGAKNVIQLALCAELDEAPGARFSYNNKATNLLAGIVAQASGLPLDKFLEDHLFAPLGIKNFFWRKDPAGNPLGMAGFNVLPEDLAKIGQLILNRGRWEGRQLLSEKWLDEMLSPSGRDSNYGLEWWLLYEKQAMVIDDSFLNKISATVDSSTLLLFQKLAGKYEGGLKEIRLKAEQLFSAEDLLKVAEAFRKVPPGGWKIANEGKIVGYVASGYLGQNLIIIPEKKLVIVRMITSENFNKVKNNSEFPQLKRLSKEL